MITSSPKLERTLLEFSKLGHIVPRTENNPYLKVSYKGAGGTVSDKWNVKVYNSGSVVCTDESLLSQLMDGTFKGPDTNLKLIQVDDSGWGSPICGVMVGVTDGVTVETMVVDVEYFRSPLYEDKGYLTQYAAAGIKILTEKYHTDPSTHRIEICTGYVNSILRNMLRGMGYDVRVAEIKGLLQDRLEQAYATYVKNESGGDFAYDPKQYLNKAAIARKYHAVVTWAKKNAPHLLKTGWEALNG